MRNGFDDIEGLPDLIAEEPIGDSGEGGVEEDSSFDPQMLEDALKPLYRGTKSTELAATILILNLCTVHGVSNNFSEELFALLHGHLLFVDNSLPKNYYTVRSLTNKLGLSYRSIHTCEKECVLFFQEHSKALRCPKCGGLRYQDE
jgi:hypothetical protein